MNEVVKAEDNMSYLDSFTPANTNKQDDNFDQSDVVIPRIKLLQGTSEEVMTFDNARPGDFWHTGMDESLGKEFNFVIAIRRKKYLLVAPMEDGQNLLASANDGKLWDQCGTWEVKYKDLNEKVTWTIPSDCAVWDKPEAEGGKLLGYSVEESGLLEWGSSKPGNPDSPPAATLFYDYLVLLPDHLGWGPAVISLARSAIKKAKRGLNDKILIHKNAGRPLQCLNFKAGPAVDEKNDRNEPFKNWKFQIDGFVSEAIYNQAVSISESMTDYKVKDETGASDEGKSKFESEEF